MFLVSEYMNYLEEENELEKMYKLKIYYFIFCILILSYYFINLIY